MAGPYTLTGSGVQAIDEPGGLSVEVTELPVGAGHGSANPVNPYGIGLLRYGNADGYFPPIPIDAETQQLALPNGMTLLGYSIATDGEIVVTELAVPSLWAGPQGATGPPGATGATGAGGVITSSTHKLTGNVACTTINTFYDGPSLSLAAGTWLLIGTVTLYNSSVATVDQWVAKLWDGTTAVASSQTTEVNSSYISSITLSAIVSPASTTTYKISVSSSTTGGSIYAATPNGGSGNNASQLNAIKIA